MIIRAFFLLPKHQIAKQQCKSSFELGYTLIEVLIAVFVLGILAAIAGPSWLSFIDMRRLTIAQDQIYQVMREAQSNARRQRTTWQVSFREAIIDEQNIVQWAIHPVELNSNQFIPNNVNWNNLDIAIQILKGRNDRNGCETTFSAQTKDSCSTTGPWRIRFNYKGEPGEKRASVAELGQITLISKNGGKAQRCVYVSTLLGAMRTGKENAKPNTSNKYCY